MYIYLSVLTRRPGRKQMGGVLGRGSGRKGENCRLLKQRIKLLQEEIFDARCKSEEENRVYEQQAVAFMAKEAQWKLEKKKWREEVGRLKKKVEEREEKIRRLEDEIIPMTVEGKSHKELQNLSATLFVEQMIEEQALREEAVEKWKRLYLVIKTELDDLILKTRQGMIAMRLKTQIQIHASLNEKHGHSHLSLPLLCNKIREISVRFHWFIH